MFKKMLHRCLLHSRYGIPVSSFSIFKSFLKGKSLLTGRLMFNTGVQPCSLLAGIVFYINYFPKETLRSWVIIYADYTIVYKWTSKKYGRPCLFRSSQVDSIGKGPPPSRLGTFHISQIGSLSLKSTRTQTLHLSELLIKMREKWLIHGTVPLSI